MTQFALTIQRKRTSWSIWTPPTAASEASAFRLSFHRCHRHHQCSRRQVRLSRSGLLWRTVALRTQKVPACRLPIFSVALVAARRSHKHGGRHGRGPGWRDQVESRGASRDLEGRSQCYYALFSDAQDDVTLGIRPGHRCVGPKDVKATAHATALHFRNGAQRPVRVTGPAVPGARK